MTQSLPTTSLFAPPDVSVGLLYRMTMPDGGPVTDEERVEWDTYQKDLEEYEHRRDLLALVDLAEEWDEPSEPTMLTERIPEGELTRMYGTKESAKSWCALDDAIAVLRQDKGVIWVDKEMGRKNIIDRLKTLGLKPANLARFTYMEFPSMDRSEESQAAWKALLNEREPALVVVDAQTEVLADADLNENSGTDIEKWSQAYLTPARRIGSAVLILDHTGHEDRGRPVASRQKGAASKVELLVRKEEPFDRNTVGRVSITVTKNTVSAPITEKQSFRIGGDGEGGFVLEPSDSDLIGKAAGRAEKEAEIEKQIFTVLEQHGELSQNQLIGMVSGRRAAIIEVARRLGQNELHAVQIKPGARGSLVYSMANEEPEDGSATGSQSGDG